jgi:hypothetical protein
VNTVPSSNQRCGPVGLGTSVPEAMLFRFPRASALCRKTCRTT